MKKYIYTLTIALGLSSCSFIEVEPVTAIDQDQAIANKTGVERALAGAYDGLQSSRLYGLQNVLIPDLLTENLEWAGTTQDYGEYDNNNMSVENAINTGIWGDSYYTINLVNNIIEKVSGLEDLSADEKLQYEAEARFIRALNYFNLYRYYGGVPLKQKSTQNTQSESINVPRSAKEEIEVLLIDDLSFAVENLQNTSPNYASKYAALGLLGKLKTIMGDYDDAYMIFDEIISEGNYRLDNSYENVFSGNSSEIIFSLEFNSQDKNQLANYFIDRKEIIPTSKFIQGYETGDLRKDYTIGAKNLVYKYPDLTTGADNVPVLRLADIILLRAETALFKTVTDYSMAVADINSIRERAGLNPISESTSKDDLLNSILKERKYEFAFEGKYWFDLLRTKKAIEVLPNVTNTDQLLMPIPLDELNTNEAIDVSDQNPGY